MGETSVIPCPSCPNSHQSKVRECFATWFTSNGGYLHPSIEIVYSDVFGYHLRVKEGFDLTPGDQIVSCPHALTISVTNADGAEPSWPHFLDFPADQAAEIVTRFFLIEQYLLQGASFWWPYMRMLPQPDQKELLATPIWYDEKDLVWIAGTNLEGARLSRLAKWQTEHTCFLRMLEEQQLNRPFPKSAYKL